MKNRRTPDGHLVPFSLGIFSFLARALLLYGFKSSIFPKLAHTICRLYSFIIPRHQLRGLSLLALCFFSAGLYAEQSAVTIKNASLTDNKGLYVLNAEINYQLGQVPAQALHNGVYLQWTVRVKFYRQRRYFWDRKLVEIQRRFRIRRHALMKMYQVTDLTQGKIDYYVTLDAALQAMGMIWSLPVIEQTAIQKDSLYYALIDVKFEPEMLPVPLQPAAFFYSDWSLSSEPYVCPLKK